MNYHFNDFTIIQLVHLLRDQEMDVANLLAVPEQREFRLPCVRKDAPNEGSYMLVIRDALLPNNTYAPDTPRDLCRAIRYEPETKGLHIEGDSGSLEFLLERVDVSALATS